MALDVSAEMRRKIGERGDYPLLDSVLVSLKDGGYAERVLGTRGWYISSPVDGWLLHGPKGAAPEPAPPLYTPNIYSKPGAVAGRFSTMPQGVILHGSRSGRPQPTAAEFWGTANFATTTDLGWNATIGDDGVAFHIPPTQWGWNARGASSKYLATEFAQPTVNDPISDAQVNAFCFWFMESRETWPALPLFFPSHAELPEGKLDGKSDVFPVGDARADDLRARIRERLSSQYGVTA